jgi:hypothetical protein
MFARSQGRAYCTKEPSVPVLLSALPRPRVARPVALPLRAGADPAEHAALRAGAERETGPALDEPPARPGGTVRQGARKWPLRAVRPCA